MASVNDPNICVCIIVDDYRSDVAEESNDSNICLELDENFLVSLKLEEILKIWEKNGGKSEDITEEAKLYFLNVFSKKPSGNELFKIFAMDGIEKIPSIFPTLSRRTSLNLVRKLFSSISFQEATKEFPLQPITSDDYHIMTYIGGYILNQLMKRKSSESEKLYIESLCDKTAEFENQSLIEALNNPEYGTLIVPVIKVRKLLEYVEKQTRKVTGTKHILERAHLKMDGSITDKIMDIDRLKTKQNEVARKCTHNICQFYFKIRLHQRAKKLKELLKVKNTSKSFRKSLTTSSSNKSV